MSQSSPARGLAALLVVALALVGAGTVVWIEATAGVSTTRVRIGWRPGVTAVGRIDAEQAFGLADGADVGERTWSYRLQRRSASEIAALLADPRIEDTHKIDRFRRQVVVELPDPDGEHNAAGPVLVAVPGLFTLLAAGWLADDAQATVRTAARTWSGVGLTLNAAVETDGGTLQARVTDTGGRVFEGFDYKDSRPIRGDGVALRLAWRKSLASLRGRSVRLEVRFRRARLYGFEVEEPV
jgi:hypothetical protein